MIQWGLTSKITRNEVKTINLPIHYKSSYNGLTSYSDTKAYDNGTKVVYIYFISNSQIGVVDDYTGASYNHPAPAYWYTLGI